MAQLHLTGDTGDPRFTYPLYVRPVMSSDICSVFVDERLCDIEPRTLDFVLNFAYDNSLQFVEACILPEGSASAKT